jgi:hypothetical protein
VTRWTRRLRSLFGDHETSVLFARRDGVWSWAAPQARNDAASLPTRHDRVDDWMVRHPGQRMRLLLSSELLHQFCLPDDSPSLHDEIALADHARQRLVHYHGSDAQRWPLAVWQAHGQSGACALHGLDLEELKALARRHDVRLAAVGPWWAAALGTAAHRHPRLGQADQAGLLLAEGRRMTGLRIARGRVVEVGMRYLDEATLSSARAAAAEWLADGGTPDGPVLLTGYGLSVVGATAVPDGPPPLQVIGDTNTLEAAHPPLDWLRSP